MEVKSNDYQRITFCYRYFTNKFGLNI